jgi:two-component system, NtrC family, sensor histidine kinase AtoS
MDEGSGFSRRIPGLTRISRSSELEALLDSLPQAALVFDAQTWRIQLANQKSIDATQYHRQDLVGLDVRKLFAGGPENTAGIPTLPAQPCLNRLVRHDQTQLTVRLSTSPLKHKETFNLLFIEPAGTLPDSPDQAGLSPFWDSLIKLFGSDNDENLLTALKRALAAARNLTGADVLVVYRLVEKDTLIPHLASDGASHLLPSHLNVQDLVYLNHAMLWETGKHPACQLYRAARAAGIHYLASAPVGQKNAVSGLVVLASQHSSPPESILETTRLLATAVDAIIQNETRLTNLRSDLQQQTSQARTLTSIAERVQEGVMRLSPALMIRSLNPRMEEMLGYTSREVAGQLAEQILIGHDSLHAALLQAQKGEPIFNFGDARFFRRDGEAFLAMLRIFPVAPADRVEEILVFIQDLSERETIRTHTQELENRALLGELTAVFAHEVRNPINNISTGLQWMTMNLKPDDPNQESITRMQQDCDRLEELIKAVLAFAKPTEYEMESLDLPLLLRRLLDRLRPRMLDKHVQCDLRVEPDCPLVLGNLRALEQVFSNLINNALQAMSEAGSGNLALKVQSVHAEEGVENVEVSIADTGPGIPKEFQERIFQPFYTTKRDGTGLGLPLSQRIITAHKGNIQFSSFPGGTIFTVRLPAAKTERRNA